MIETDVYVVKDDIEEENESQSDADGAAHQCLLSTKIVDERRTPRSRDDA